MLKVDNKKVIHDLARITYQGNKKRNLLTIAAIFLTTFLICTVLSIGLSYWDAIGLRQQRMQGMDYDMELTEPREDQIAAIRSMDHVTDAGLSVKCAIVSKYQKTELDKIQLFWLDDICWSRQTIPALDTYEGNYPVRENELMLSKSALDSMGINQPSLGMELPLLYQNLSDRQPNEEIQKTFVLSGWFLDYTGRDKGYVSHAFYKTTGALPTDLTQGSLKISLKNPLYTEQDIIEMQNQISLSGNQIIEADYDTISSFVKTTAALAVLLTLIFLSGYLFIFNTLYLSVNKDIRYFGQLKTLGTTSVQIRRILYQQMIWNALLGIPIGLFCSALVGKLVIPQLLHTLNPAIAAADVKAASLYVFVAAAVFSFAAAMISSQKPAKTAMNCSPVEAMNYIGKTPGKIRNNRRTGGDIRSMVKINLFRDKKQFVIILCSLSLAVSLFLVINIVIAANNAAAILNHSYDYDFRILNQTLLSENEKQVITPDLLEPIRSIEGVKDVRILKSATAVVLYQEDVYGAYYRELYQTRYTPGNYEEDMKVYQKDPEHYLFTCRIVGIDDLEFERINATLDTPLDPKRFKNGETAFVSKSFTQGDNGIPGKKVSFSLPSARNPKQAVTLETGPVIDDFPAYYSAGYTPDLIVSETLFDRLVAQPLIEMVKIDYEEPFDANTEASVRDLLKTRKQLSAESKLDRYSEMKRSENQITVLGGSLGLIVMLLALSNYLNMMSASIQHRSREFAVLESIGMTRKQLKTMIVSESLCYAVLSILLSLIIGLPASVVVFASFNAYRLPFAFPIVRNLLLFASILVICAAASLFVFSKSKNETIIELLRRNEF